MSSEELLRRDVREEFAKSRSYFRVARALNIPMEKVKAILQDDTPPIQRREPMHGGEGRPEMRKYKVASKHVDTAWDNTNSDIVLARADYELGTHEMTTGRDGDTIILYSIPRVQTTPRPGYFNPGYTA